MIATVGQSIFRKHESEVRGYCRSFDSMFNSASGSIVRDTNSREYIDFLAACGSLNYGHNDPDMRQALLDHIAGDGLSAGLDLYSTSKAEFLDRFQRLILQPRNLEYRLQFTGPTGTNAVEAAMKLARKVTGRNNIIAFTNGFHGVSLGSLAATGNKYNRMGATLPNVTRAPFDGYMGSEFNTAEYLEKLISDPSGGVEAPAAILLETVQGEGGLNSASPEWLQQIEAIARQHDALLIIDDIQAGCGRTGTFFSFENMGIKPDIVTLSKSISGYGLPMALVLINPVYDQWQPAEHNGTFRGNTHAFVTAAVALKKFWSDTQFSQSIFARADLITRRLQQIKMQIPGSSLKGRGMMQGLALPSEKLAQEICRQCFEQGLIIETSGPYDEVIKILAPLTTPLELLDQGLGILQQTSKQVTGKRNSSAVSTAARSNPGKPLNVSAAPQSGAPPSSINLNTGSPGRMQKQVEHPPA